MCVLLVGSPSGCYASITLKSFQGLWSAKRPKPRGLEHKEHCAFDWIRQNFWPFGPAGSTFGNPQQSLHALAGVHGTSIGFRTQCDLQRIIREREMRAESARDEWIINKKKRWTQPGGSVWPFLIYRKANGLLNRLLCVRFAGRSIIPTIAGIILLGSYSPVVIQALPKMEGSSRWKIENSPLFSRRNTFVQFDFE